MFVEYDELTEARELDALRVVEGVEGFVWRGHGESKSLLIVNIMFQSQVFLYHLINPQQTGLSMFFTFLSSVE